MPLTAADTHRAIEAVKRKESAKLIAALARVMREGGLAEELTQDALVVALERWPETGVAVDPGAWLTATAQHRAIDLLRRSAMSERKHEEISCELVQFHSTQPINGLGRDNAYVSDSIP